MPDAVDRFFSGFYRDPTPALAADALEQALARGPLSNAAVVMFVRAVQLSDAVRNEIHARAERVPEARRILAHADDPSLPDPNTMPLLAPGDLDVAWAEFLLTGSDHPVRRIAEVLDREDCTRSALAAWSAHQPWLPWSRAAKTRTTSALAEKGLTPDNPTDLDLVLWKWMSGGFQVRSELPFPVTDDLVLHLATKGAACGSLQSNARQHPVVRTVVDALPASRGWPAFA